MELQVGRKYRLASGQVVGPMEQVIEKTGEIKFVSCDFVEGYMPIWKKTGLPDFFLYSHDQNKPEWTVVKEVLDESL